MRFRSAIAPTLLIMALLGCDETAPTQADVFDENQNPKQNELDELRWRCQAFLSEHNPEVSVEGFTFNQLTPNVYLVGANVYDSATKSKYVKNLSVERLKDIGEDDEGDLHELDQKVFVIDYADPFKMAQIANRHGFASEVQGIYQHNDKMAGNGYHDSWIDAYIMWSILYNRPQPVYYGYGTGFVTRPVGYRFYSATPMSVSSVRSGFGWMAASRSTAFSSGLSRNPPNVTRLSPGGSGKVFSSAGGKGVSVSTARGGFGGRAGGFSGSSGS